MTRNDITKGLETIKNDKTHELHAAWINGDSREFKYNLDVIREILDAAEEAMKNDMWDNLCKPAGK